MQKLLRSQLQAYGDTSPARYQRLNQVWDDYNSGRIDPPPLVSSLTISLGTHNHHLIYFLISQY